MRPFRFLADAGEVVDAKRLSERARRVEALGYSALVIPDHLLEQLAPKKRVVLVMHDLQGIEAARIAELVGSNVLTVRTRLFYARREFEALAKGDAALSEFFEGGGE